MIKGELTHSNNFILLLHIAFCCLQIVPPNQAEMMYQAVKLKGLPTMYILFEGKFIICLLNLV